MTSHRDDIPLDACLEEVLAGRAPPDLQDRILQAWAIRRASRGLPNLNGSLPPLPGPAVAPGFEFPVAPPRVVPVSASAPPPAAAPPVIVADRASRGRSRRERFTTAHWAIAATLAAAVLIAVTTWLRDNRLPGGQLAKPAAPATEPSPPLAKAAPRSPQPSERVVTQAPRSPKPGVSPPGGSSTPAPAGQLAKGSPPAVVPQPLPTSPELAPVGPPSPSPAVVATPDYRQPASDREILSFVSAELSRGWKDAKINPSEQASDQEWCRRLFVRLIGRIPTVEELRQFTASKSKRKREELVDRLLTHDDYREALASHWSHEWADLLVGRTVSSTNPNRQGLEQYLRSAFYRNLPYRQIAAELLTAVGSPTPGQPDFNGAAGFLALNDSKEAGNATARTARVFLGHQLQCAQCHQHPSQDWSQQDYWSFNAFFRQLEVQKQGDVLRLADIDFVEIKSVTTEGEVYYETPSGAMKSAFPEFLGGEKIPTSGRLSEVNRRSELARLIVESPQFSRAFMNRLWSHFLGYGFTRPVDDMGPANQPAQPELLDRLAGEFEASGYNIRKAMRWIVLSDPFQRSSKIPAGNLADLPEAGDTPLFSRYYTRQLQSQEVFDSLLIAADLRKNSKTLDTEQARRDWLAQFHRPMGTDDADEETHFNGSVRQSLIMMNGDLMRHASSKDAGMLKSLSESPLKPEEKVAHLFLAALSRDPSPREREAAAKLLAFHKGNLAAALEDIWWALLNSNEFILDH